ncbi:MAG TPA: AsmA family protein, partial [Mycobacterium sp.]|nr:AsmA family protein [Mycobacterium sp.]
MAAAALLLLVDVNQFREPIRAQLEKRLSRAVQIGGLGLKLVPLSIRLDDVAVGQLPQFSSQAPFVAAKQTFVRVSLGALLKKQVDVESVRIVQPAVELIKDANGQWNLATFGGAPGARSGSGGGGASVDIADLRIEDGRVAITDLQQKKPRAVYDHIDITLKDFTPGKRFDFDAQAHLPAKGKELIAAHLSAVTPAVPSKLADSDFDGNVSLEAVSLTGLQSFLGSTPSEVAKSVFNGKLDFQSRGGMLNGKGAIEVSEPRLKQPAKIQFEVREDTSAGILSVPSATVTLGGLSANGNAKVHTKETPATVTAEMRTSDAAVADLLRLATAFGAVEGISGDGTLSLDAHISGPANSLAYDAAGSLRDAKLTLPSLRKPVEIQSVTFKATKDSAALDNLSAAVGSSHLKG